jgi:probable HAF family extracellular repeat protein
VAAGPQLAFTVQPVTTTAGAAIPSIQVTAQDAQGNTVTTFTGNVTIAFGANPAGGVLAGDKTNRAVSGVATFASLSIKKAGAGYTLVASAPAASGYASGTSAAFDITPAPASKLAFTVQPTSTEAGDTISPPVQVSAQDTYGNTATSFGDNIVLTLRSCMAGSVLSGTVSVPAVGGIASFADLWLNKSGNCGLKATSGSFSANSVTFVVGPANPTHLIVFTKVQNTVAGTPLGSISVVAKDRFENTASGFTGAVTMAIDSGPIGATLSGTTTVTAVSGTAVFSTLVLQNIGPYVLLATTDSLAAATSNAFIIKAAPPTHLAFTVQPSDAAPGAIIAPPIEVTVRDAYDNPVKNAGSVQMTIGSNPGGGTLLGTTLKGTSTGVATFANLRINNAGTGYTLVATLGNLPSVTSAPFNIGTTPAQLAFTVQPSTTAAGATITPAVQVTVRDAQGNTVTTFGGAVSISIGTNPSGGVLSGTAQISATSGVATFANLSINNPGVGYTLHASAAGLIASSVAFDITNSAPAFVDLGTLPGHVYSYANAINSNGQVVGVSGPSGPASHAFLWQNGTMTDLGTLGGIQSGASDINDNGQVAGVAMVTGDTSHAFLWQNGTMTDLGTLGGGVSVANGINNSGQVVGISKVADTVFHAFLWQNGTMTDIGSLGGTLSEARSINDNSQVVGDSYIAGNVHTHGFFWQNGVMTDLGTLGGTQSQAFGINNNGQVVGTSYTTGNAEQHAFLWQNGTMTDLGTLGGTHCQALGINDNGQVVGYSETGVIDPETERAVIHAFLWQNGTMTDLGAPLGGILSMANAINANGQVVGLSNTTDNNTNRAVMWTGFQVP